MERWWCCGCARVGRSALALAGESWWEASLWTVEGGGGASGKTLKVEEPDVHMGPSSPPPTELGGHSSPSLWNFEYLSKVLDGPQSLA